MRTLNEHVPAPSDLGVALIGVKEGSDIELDLRLEAVHEGILVSGTVIVEPMGEGLLAEYCRHRGVSAIVKGLRSSSDFDYELPMATMNRQLAGVETVFLPAEAHYVHLSSTLIKEVNVLGGDISDFVPKSVLKRLLAGEPATEHPRKG